MRITRNKLRRLIKEELSSYQLREVEIDADKSGDLSADEVDTLADLLRGNEAEEDTFEHTDAVKLVATKALDDNFYPVHFNVTNLDNVIQSLEGDEQFDIDRWELVLSVEEVRDKMSEIMKGRLR